MATERFSWKEAAELTGIAAVVASLIFVGLQMRHEQRLTEAQVYADVESNTLAFANLINQNRELWARGLTGEELSDTELANFRTLVRVFDRRRWMQYERGLRLNLVPSPDIFIENYALDLYRFPGLRKTFEEMVAYQRFRANAFGRNMRGSFYQQVIEHLEHLDESKPDVSALPNQPY